MLVERADLVISGQQILGCDIEAAPTRVQKCAFSDARSSDACDCDRTRRNEWLICRFFLSKQLFAELHP